MGRHPEGKRLVKKSDAKKPVTEAPQPALWSIQFKPAARRAFNGILDQRVKAAIRDRITGLSKDPEQQGKALVGPLLGCRSLRVAGQRYRIVYRVQKDTVVVIVLNLGIRKEGDKSDVYSLTQRMVRLGLLDSP